MCSCAARLELPNTAPQRAILLMHQDISLWPTRASRVLGTAAKLGMQAFSNPSWRLMPSNRCPAAQIVSAKAFATLQA